MKYILKYQNPSIPIQRRDNISLAPKEKINSISINKQQQWNLKNFGTFDRPTQRSQTFSKPIIESKTSKRIAENRILNKERLDKFAEEQRIDKERELTVAPYVAIGLAGALTGTLPAMITGEIAGQGIEKVSQKLTGKSFGENVLPEAPVIGSFLNPGYVIGGGIGAVGTNLDRKIAEIGLRAGDFNFSNLKRTLLHPSTHKYLLTGNENILKRTASKGFVDDLSPHSYNGSNIRYSTNNPANLEQGDYIDIFLGRNKPSLLREIKTNDFGVHTDYINKNYANKKNKIRTFSVSSTDEPVIYFKKQSIIDYMKKDFNQNKIQGKDNIIRGDLGTVDAAGHLEYNLSQGDNYLINQQQDIWKYNPKDYMERWHKGNPLESTLLNKMSNIIKQSGLKLLDKVGTPIITKSAPIKYIVNPNLENSSSINLIKKEVYK